MGIQVTLKNVRLSFPRLWKMEKFKDSKPAYSASFLISADDPQADTIENAIIKAADEKWGVKAKGFLAAARGKDKVPLHNGDAKADVEGYEGMYYLSARSYTRVTVVDRDRSILSEESGRPYGGCYVDANVEIYCYDVDGVKGVTASLRWVQFRRDGDAFAGGAPVTDDEIEDLSVADDDETSAAGLV